MSNQNLQLRLYGSSGREAVYRPEKQASASLWTVGTSTRALQRSWTDKPSDIVYQAAGMLAPVLRNLYRDWFAVVVTIAFRGERARTEASSR